MHDTACMLLGMGDPSITVSILFTDIEGSTRLLQRLGDNYRRVLDDHFRLIGTSVATAGGTIANTMGDGLLTLFPTASQALQAAMEAQRSLAAHTWPAAGIVRVRMGVHSGEVSETPTGHVGLDVHRAARICSAAYGGQILASAAVVSLCRDEQEDAASFIDLGRHFLKDLEKPEHLFQVVVPGLLSEFPPPRSKLTRPHNLPSEVTDFVGRQSEIEEVERLLKTARLLTLTGPGGTGKTRLALRVARRLVSEFDDGVFFVPLSAVRDPGLVASAIARTIGVGEEAGHSVLDKVKDHLATKKLLLILDNFEQLIDAAGDVAELVSAAPELNILVTSQTLLHASGEQVLEIIPLAVPDPNDVSDLARLAATDGVDLFIRRVRAVKPNFELTSRNASAVARIVARLEGLPLAIELAAARSRLFPPEILVERLDKPFKILSGGSSEKEGHHRTLRDAIAWSYSLLNEAEQAAFRRLGVFHGGFTVEAAESIATGDPVADVLETVSSLLDKSLVRSLSLHGEARLLMLETIREFALEELDAAGEMRQAQARHASLFRAFTEEMEAYLTGPAEAATIDRLTADHPNIQAALRFCLETGDADAGLRIAGSLWRFWHATGQSEQGRKWLVTLLAKPEPSSSVRAKGLSGLAGIAYWQADYSAALASYSEALKIYQEIGDRLMEADTLLAMSTTSTWNGQADEGGELAEQAIGMFRALGARGKVGMVLMAQGFAKWMKDDLDGARPLWEESLAIAREVGDHVEAASKMLALASISFRQGRKREAIADALSALNELVELKNVSLMIMALDWLAALAAERDPERSVRLAAAAAKLRSGLGGGMRPESCGLENARSVAARSFDAATIARAWVAGEEMKLQEAVELARKLGSAVSETAPANDLVHA